MAVVGIFRSGTNFLRSLLELNYQVKIVYNAYGWKHGLVPVITKNNVLGYPRLPTLAIARNPFSAINALFRYATNTGANIHCCAEWHHFLRGRFVVYDKWNPASPELWFPNAVHYWTAMNWNHLSIGGSKQSVCLVRYEDLLTDPEAETHRIASRFNLQRLPAQTGFVHVSNRVRNMGDRTRTRLQQYTTARQFDDRNFYLSHAYMESFTKEDRSFVCDRLDNELLARMGYDTLVQHLLA